MPVIDAPRTMSTAQACLSAGEWLRARSEGDADPGSLLFHAPSYAFQAPGGGENQLVQTGRYLESIGHSVRLLSPWVDRMEQFRLLHLFGMSREGLELARIARRRGLPIVVSPICWFEPSALFSLGSNRLRGIVDAAKWSMKSALPKLPCWRGELLKLADRILPNSCAEADQLVRLFGVDRARVCVVPNGVEDRFALATSSLFENRFNHRPEVLYVGRIEPRKNVLGLIEAVKIAGLAATIIGRVPPGSEAYAQRCKDAGRGHVRFLPAMAHDDPALASAYASARVFALPSWFETPGLSALEAGMAGAAVVITPNGCTREYFQDQAIYSGPQSPQKIARALARAVELGAHPELSARLRSEYPWTEVARRTAEAYDNVAQ